MDNLEITQAPEYCRAVLNQPCHEYELSTHGCCLELGHEGNKHVCGCGKEFETKCS